MRYGSICSGVAPQTNNWAAMGLECAWFAEIEDFPSAVLKYRFPEIPNLGDFTKIGKEHGPIELLVGGTPCQSFSVAGLRGGLADDRGNLALEFLRLADRLRPRWLVWENVPGVLSSDGGRDFGSILGGMVELGYGFAYRVLDAQHFGVPQRRRRVFVVGHLGDWRRAAAVLFERHSLSGHPAPRREKREGVTHPVAPCLGASGRRFERTGDTRGQDAGGFFDEPTHSLRADGFDASEDGTGRGSKEATVVAFNHKASSHQNMNPSPVSPTLEVGKSDGVAVYQIQSVNMVRERKQNGIGISEEDSSYTLTGRDQHAVAFRACCQEGFTPSEIAPPVTSTDGGGAGAPTVACFSAGQSEGAGTIAYQEGQSPTLRGAASGTNQVPALHSGMAVRRLTPRECERLQGMDDDWTLVPYRGKLAADGPRYKSIGNSWAVPVLTWIGRRIMEVDGK